MKRRSLGPRRHPLLPDDTPTYMQQAWTDMMAWAVDNKEVMQRFREETGEKWKPATNPIDRMIDEATNASDEFFKKFIIWANINLWGPFDADKDR